MPPPSNLKVLPKDTSGQEVMQIMHHFEGELGVECNYCHYSDPDTHRMNFASDANPMKDRARVMIRMTEAIDSQYLTQLTNPKPAQDVTCGTCHQGMPKPMPFIPPKHEEHEHHEAPGAPATPPPSM